MKTIKYITAIILAGVFFFACTDFDDLNQDPTKSTDLDPNLQIPTIQMRQSENHQEWHRYFAYPMGFMNQWTADWATVEYGGQGKKYDNFLEQLWMSYYPFMIKNVVDIIERTKDDPEYVNVNAIARILKVQCFLKLTDVYGDVPYFNAGMGYYSGIYNAPYDKQEDIYNDFFEELKQAEAALDASGDMLTYDLYYDGNISKWKKLANSFRLRIAMRLIKVNPAKAREEAEAAIAAGVLESNSDICYVKHENSINLSEGVGRGNGVATRLRNPEDPTLSNFRLATDLITVLEESNDPRIRLIAGCYYTDGNRTDITDLVKAQLGTYVAMSSKAQAFVWDDWRPAIDIVINGETVTLEHSLQRLQPSKLLTEYDAPYIHFSYAEVLFLKAEVAARGWNAGGTAQEFFAEGLRAAINQWTLFGGNPDAAAVESYVQANPLESGNELLQINTQLWILHILDPFETWSNWRRTGMPDIKFYNTLPAVNQTGGKTPRRLEYPVEEQMKNKANYDEALSRMGGTDDWMNRIWWDKE